MRPPPLGILFAPRSGGENRRLIAQKAQQATDRLKATVDQGQEYIERRGTDLRGQANELIDQGKEAVHRKTDQLTRAVAAGTEAYRSRIDDAETGGGGDRWVPPLGDSFGAAIKSEEAPKADAGAEEAAAFSATRSGLRHAL